MLYNIDFNVAATIFLVIFYLFLKFQYASEIVSNRVFRYMIVSVLVANTLDAVTAVTISYTESVPVALNYFLNVVYYLSAPFCAMMMPIYVRYLVFQDGKRRIGDNIGMVAYVIYALIACSSPITHWMFYFDADKVYLYGPLHIMINVMPMVYLLLGYGRTLVYRKKLTKKQFVTLNTFMVVAISGTILQVTVMGNTLVIYFLISVATYILAFTQETMDYRKLQETLRVLEQTTEDAKNAELAAELSRNEAIDAREEAENANRAKSNFLANMSHEIRTPINGILGMNDIALSENKDPAIEEYLLNIRDAGTRLLQIINDVLDFSKIESGKFEIAPEEYMLSSTLYSTYNLIEPKARDKGLGFKVENNPLIPSKLFGDDSRICQIMVNLLGNAVKYTHQGRVTLTLDFEALDENSSEDRGVLIIKVKDTGIGISAEDQKKLFNSFQRVNLQANRNIEGSGLGLKITKQLTDLMEGTITFTSALNEGSEFVVRIPQKIIDVRPMGKYMMEKQQLQTAPATTALTSGEYKAPKARVLVVDDVQMNLKVVKGLLKKTEITVDTVLSGRECIEMISREKYDIIFLDHMMPEMDGIETFEYMQMVADSKNLDTPVIILTANAIQGAKEEYLEKGFNDYLAKPINNQELLDMLKKYIKN